MQKLWLFGATKFQGNPKFLFSYISKRYPEIHAYWIADTQEQVNYIKKLGLNVVLMGSNTANNLFAEADVYVVENFRESLPKTINPDITIANLWHGVGIKAVEFGVGNQSIVSDSIVRKFVRNYSFYRNNLAFLAPSKFMEQHFREDMRLQPSQIIRGPYPRNQIACLSELATYNHNNIDGKKINNFNKVYLYAPTYRESANKITIQSLFKDIEKIKTILIQKNALLIFKMHHFEEQKEDYLHFKTLHSKFNNFLFWDNNKDIYEIFDKIDTAIIDYSSIFYDLLQAGVPNAIRYVPDLEEYENSRGTKFDYLSHSGGTLVQSFDDFITALSADANPIENRAELLDLFFGYSDQNISKEQQMASLIHAINSFTPSEKNEKNLYSFDVFDTLICRQTVEPVSVFFAVQEKLRQSNAGFSSYFIENYPQIRREIEADTRDVYRKTTFERDTDAIEITFDAMFERLADNYCLNDSQTALLKSLEIECELAVVSPLPQRINRLLKLAEQGHHIILISDMYLPESVVKQLLHQADPRLDTFKLYLSSTIGYQKSTGKLYKHIFFDLDYQYANWFHFGDNFHADHQVPKRFGIKPIHHQMNHLLPLEKGIVNKFGNADGYRLAGMMSHQRWSNLKNPPILQFNSVFQYAYNFGGPFFTPYILWLIKDAIERGYETLYFISRDGHYLKKIADLIIEKRNYPIKTRYIFGSRKAWRLPAQIDRLDDEFFTNFGLFTGMNSFEDLINASQLDEEELLEILPEVENFRYAKSFRGKVAEEIRSVFFHSEPYKQRLLEISREKRQLVEDYLAQEINFNEKIAFVEYWGRGYTQNLLTRLLEHVSDKKFPTPFYYVRSFYSTDGSSIRHRYTQQPTDFAFIEAFFANTPYKSIASYERSQISNKVEPIITPENNDIDNTLTHGLLAFTEDYLKQNFIDEDLTGRILSDYVWKYHKANPHDQLISSVYANFLYNINAWGQDDVYAPSFTLKDIQENTIKKLVELTNNLAISLSRSGKNIYEAYLKKCKSEKIKPIKVKPTEHLFPVNSLDRYLNLKKFPSKIILLKNTPTYSSVNFNDAAELMCVLKIGEIVKVQEIIFNAFGCPRFLTEYGYITAHKSFSREHFDFEEAETSSVEQKTNNLPEATILNVKSGDKLTALSDIIVYREPAAKKIYMTQYMIHQGDLVVVDNLAWGKGRVPFIQIGQGFILAYKTLLAPTSKSIAWMLALNGKSVQLKTTKSHFIDSRLSQPSAIKKLKKGTIIDNCKLLVEKDKILLNTLDGFCEVKETDFQIARRDGNNFIATIDTQQYSVLPTSRLKVYQDIGFTLPANVSKMPKGIPFKPEKIEWTEKGTPRFKVKRGYVTTNKKFVKLIKDNNLSFIQKILSNLFGKLL